MTSMDAEHHEESEPVRKVRTERTGSFCARKALVLGLTGGIATGKSTVASMFADLGARVISADRVVHDLLKHGTPVWHEVVAEFGEEIVDSAGEIDRGRLGGIVFSDPEKRLKLESIIHPRVLGYLRAQAEEFRKCGQGVLVLEIPLLVEVSAFDLVDKVLVVTAEQGTQIRRLEERSGISSEEALRRITSQMPLSKKVQYGDWVVSTDGSLCSTKAQVYKVWKDIQKPLAQPK
jgi:dephospho-CoA kinase